FSLVSTTRLQLDAGRLALEHANTVITSAARSLRERGGVDSNQALAYDLAHAASALAVAACALDYGQRGVREADLAAAFVSSTLRELGGQILGRETLWNVEADWFEPLHSFVEAYTTPAFLAPLAEVSAETYTESDLAMLSSTFHRFAEREIRPHAEHVHRTNADVPESVIDGLKELGAFGLSIPPQYGGASAGERPSSLAMVVATEELSWGSLAIGGSLVTRPEILSRALLGGGTAAQRATWLPQIARGEVLCAIAVTEPDCGSDVAALTTRATRTEGGWLLSGAKTWCTFAARATLLAVLARTDPDRSLAHRGLSLFLVEKPPSDSGGFAIAKYGSESGRITGRPIDTIGYRGLHSYELSFDEWFVGDDCLVGGEQGLGRGFYLQMAGFESGRLQTAARALGLMQAAYDDALSYARQREVFGRALIDYELTRVKLANMLCTIRCARQFTLEVAGQVEDHDSPLRAAMAKAFTSRAAEWVTREAMQIHGGMGYAEEFGVSRYFLDARVLSIFEGADETLCLKVIAPRLLGVLEGT
ncbi:MAG TPA: acyl-CoA dehydrogenase family protein, partial [Acidimicrobiales bacterium]|nr:acyl-CoA dehydrogenase family protein [Acidimicrobiales bacterium]